MKLNYQRLHEEVVRAAPDPAERARVTAHTAAVFADRAVRDNFSLAAVFEAAFGYEEFRACRGDRRARTAHQVFEAAGAVNTAAFQNIVGQWAYQSFLDAYNAPERVFSQAIPTRQSDLKTERIAGIAPIGDEALVVDEAKKYPIAGVSENWIDTPETLKRGVIVPVTWEAMFFDRTNQIRSRVSDLATWMGVNKEKRAIDCVIDAGETAQNRYRYRWLGTVIATYGDNSGTHNWDNLAATNPLADYGSLETAWNLFKTLRDPFTNEPLDIMPKDLVVPPGLIWKVPFAVGGTINRIVPGYATSGNPVGTQIDNPAGTILGQMRTLSNQLLADRLAAAGMAAGTWFLGDVAKAFEYIQNIPIETTTAPAGSEAEFEQDIVLRTKVREMGTFCTKEPRAMEKNTP